MELYIPILRGVLIAAFLASIKLDTFKGSWWISMMSLNILTALP